LRAPRVRSTSLPSPIGYDSTAARAELAPLHFAPPAVDSSQNTTLSRRLCASSRH
jgi:hypothetical protein